uniref:Glutathione peroxidase n=1 Tax=Oncorhynchus kisutch TaxID=8019 RepID=A0A8C7DSC0_ONCKI
PRNRFGHQNCKNDEILTFLKYIGPGNGFEPKFPLISDSMAFMGDPKFITWSLVCRNGISWNFDKFPVGYIKELLKVK